MLLNAVILADEAFVPPLATGNTPVTPVVIGKPVQLVSTPADGVPILGVDNVGAIARTGAPDPLAVVHTGLAAPPPTSISVFAPADK